MGESHLSFYRWLQEHYGADSDYARRVAAEHSSRCPCAECRAYKYEARKALRKGKRK